MGEAIVGLAGLAAIVLLAIVWARHRARSANRCRRCTHALHDHGSLYTERCQAGGCHCWRFIPGG